MDLVKLEFDLRKYTNKNDTKKYKDYTIRLTFDKLDSVTIDENLQVCTSETIRGKNKTFNAYEKPTDISINGKFSDKQSTNIEIEEIDTSDQEVETLLSINKVVGQDKSKILNGLFTSMIEDTRLINIKMFYGDYDNYVLNNFNLFYINNSTINVELNFQQIMLRYLNEFKDEEINYQEIEQLEEEEWLRLKYILSRLPEIAFSIVEGTPRSIYGWEIEDYVNTHSEGGNYGY